MDLRTNQKNNPNLEIKKFQKWRLVQLSLVRKFVILTFFHFNSIRVCAIGNERLHLTYPFVTYECFIITVKLHKIMQSRNLLFEGKIFFVDLTLSKMSDAFGIKENDVVSKQK